MDGWPERKYGSSDHGDRGPLGPEQGRTGPQQDSGRGNRQLPGGSVLPHARRPQARQRDAHNLAQGNARGRGKGYGSREG